MWKSPSPLDWGVLPCAVSSTLRHKSLTRCPCYTRAWLLRRAASPAILAGGLWTTYCHPSRSFSQFSTGSNRTFPLPINGELLAMPNHPDNYCLPICPTGGGVLHCSNLHAALGATCIITTYRYFAWLAIDASPLQVSSPRLRAAAGWDGADSQDTIGMLEMQSGGVKPGELLSLPSVL